MAIHIRFRFVASRFTQSDTFNFCKGLENFMKNEVTVQHKAKKPVHIARYDNQPKNNLEHLRTN